MSYILKNDYVTRALITPDMFLRIVEALDGTRMTDIKLAGKLELAGQIFIGINELLATATELNTLHNRTAGTNESGKPLIPDAQRAVDYLRVQQLSAAELLLDAPSVADAVSKIYAFNNFI